MLNLTLVYSSFFFVWNVAKYNKKVELAWVMWLLLTENVQTWPGGSVCQSNRGTEDSGWVLLSGEKIDFYMQVSADHRSPKIMEIVADKSHVQLTPINLFYFQNLKLEGILLRFLQLNNRKQSKVAIKHQLIGCSIIIINCIVSINVSQCNTFTYLNSTPKNEPKCEQTRAAVANKN